MGGSTTSSLSPLDVPELLAALIVVSETDTVAGFVGAVAV